MTDITIYIKELLFKHDCVILPSFGGFIGNYRPAQIDESTNTFSPPVKAISFNRNLTHNDGLLIGKVSQDKKIGYADSKSIVDQFIENLTNRLEKGERVTLDRIGYLYHNDEGNIQFEPDRESNFLLDSYGFTSFRRDPVSNFDLTRRSIGRDHQPLRPSATRKMAIRAAIAVPIIAAMILVPLKTDILKNRATLNPVAAIELLDTVAGDKIITSDDEVVSQIVESTEVEAAVEQKSYYIVAGSFKNQENAVRLIEEAGKKGYKAELSLNEEGYYRVYIDSFSDKQDAISRRAEVVSDYPEVWVLSR